MEIKPISIPRNIIQELPPPVTDITPPPVVNGIQVPIIDVPIPTFDYPTIDVPTRQEFEGQIQQPPQETEESPTDTRDLPPSPPSPAVPQNTIDVPGVGEVPVPEAAPLVTAGATAVVAATVTMGATILLNQVKSKLLGPALERMAKKKKVKIKQKKPVLHFVKAEDGIQVFEYSVKGTRLRDKTENIEQYLRDQVDLDSLYEYDNILIINDDIKEMFTKEGQKRFKKYFRPAIAIVKKLSARLSL